MGCRDIAETAQAWISATAPADLVAPLGALVAEWREADLPAYVVWRVLSRRFGQCGLLDPAIESGRRALASCSDNPQIMVELARLKWQAGDDDGARALAEAVPPTHEAYAEALLVLADLAPEPDAELAAELAQILMARPSWVDLHDQGLGLLRRWTGNEAAAAFLIGWMKAHAPSPPTLMHLGQVLLEAGHHEQAGPILTNLWRANAAQLQPIIGEFCDRVPPDDQTEGDLLARVEHALAQPDDTLVRHCLPEPTKPLPERVLYVGPAMTGVSPSFPNDLAWHLGNAAALAGTTLERYDDPAITGPGRARLSDTARAERIAALAAHVRAARPEVMILDCCWSPLRGDLDPPTLAGLAAETDMRVLCLFRDAQSPTLSLIRHWSTAADGIITFDPFSAIFDEGNADLAAKTLVVPVPALASPRPSDRPPSRGLTFIGGLGQVHRPILVGALLASGIDFSAVIGDERRRLAPDLESYGRLLGDSRAALNIAVHHQDQRLITGRIWETIAAGGLLLEQGGSGITAFFTPYRHYLPWSNIADIVQAYRFLERHDDLRRAMIAAARDWSARHYGPDRVWRALMAWAMRGSDDHEGP